MGAPPTWPDADEDVLETARPLRRRTVLAAAGLTLATLAAVAAVVVARHHPHPPPPAAFHPPLPPAASVQRIRVADVLVQAEPIESWSRGGDGTFTYWTALTNPTGSTIRLGTPLVRGPGNRAVPGATASLTPGRPRGGAEPLSGGPQAHLLRPHGVVTVTLQVRLGCSRAHRHAPPTRRRALRIVVPVAGYRRDAVFSFASLFAGLGPARVVKCVVSAA